MIVYRCISRSEILCMIGIDSYINAPHGSNTFHYESGVSYKHFFYYYDSAVSFMKTQNRDRYYDKYSLIIAYNISDKLLKDFFGLGKYNFECVPKHLKDELLSYFKVIFFPEFAIPENLITKDMIVGIGDDKNIMPLTRQDYYLIDSSITESQKSFLEYQKWLFDNGTDVSLDKVVKNVNKLFPLSDKNKIKIKIK